MCWRKGKSLMKIEESIIIKRSPNDVFAFLAARRNDPVWMESVLESEWLEPVASDTDAPPERGRRGRMVMKSMGRRIEYIDEVTDFVSGKRIAHRTVEGPISLTTACITETEGDGCRTTVMVEADAFLSGRFGKLGNFIVAGLVRRGFKADLIKLRGILESKASDTHGVGLRHG
jgi:hypothetical protein